MDSPTHTPSSLHVVIVGGGIAGSMLAFRMALQGVAVSLFDDYAPHSASRVAAGLFNVITGRFGAKSWLAEDLLAQIQHLYEHPDWACMRAHIHYGPIYRPFKTIEAYNKWTGRLEDPSFSQLVAFHEQPIYADQLHNELGGIMIQPCGWTDIAGLIESLHRRLQAFPQVKLYEGLVDYEGIDMQQHTLSYHGEQIDFDQIVFAGGHRLTHNPHCAYLPLIPNKGEILLIEAPSLALPFSLSKKIYLIQVAPQQYVVGSTYQNHPEDPHPTQAAREEILAHLDRAIRVPYRVLDQRAGIRPTTPNRRPLVGRLPQYPNAYVLGGFGTKGMLLSPTCSLWLQNLMLHDIDHIPAQANLARYADLL